MCFWIRTNSGDRKHIFFRLASIDYDSNSPRILTFFSDQTERKRVEESLQKSQMKYKLMNENVCDVHCQLTSYLKFSYISPADEVVKR